MIILTRILSTYVMHIEHHIVIGGPTCIRKFRKMYYYGPFELRLFIVWLRLWPALRVGSLPPLLDWLKIESNEPRWVQNM